MEPFRSRPGRENFFPNPTRPKILSFGTTQNTTLIERLRDLLGRDQRGEKSLPSIWPNTTKIIFLDLLGRNPVGVTVPGNQKCKNPSFCRSMNSYRIVMKRTRYKKPLPSSEVFFWVIFLARSDAPSTPNRPKTNLRVILKTFMLQFKVLLSTGYLQRPEMCSQHQDFFYLVKLLHKKLPQKFLVPGNIPRTSTSNQKFAIFCLLTKLRLPNSRGRGCRSAEIFLSQNHFI